MEDEKKCLGEEQMFTWGCMSDSSVVQLFLIIVTKKKKKICVVVECYYKLWSNQNFSFISVFLLSFITLSFRNCS